MYLKIEIDYSEYWLFELEEGLQFLKQMSKVNCVRKSPGKNNYIGSPDLTIKLMSEQEYKELQLKNVLNAGDD